MARALAVLPPETRLKIWLHDVEGYIPREIGELTGQTASYAKSQLARGCGKLTQLLRGNGDDGTKPTLSDLLALRDGEPGGADAHRGATVGVRR